MQPPKCLHRNLHDISISWEEIKEFGSYEDSSKVYQLQINNEVKQWTTIYCGKNTLFKVDSLAPCRSYSFRIRIKSQESDWVYFKAATVDPGPYTSVIHMTRAIKLGNTSNIRKIAQISPVLLNTENKEYKTPIFQAIEAKDFQVLQLLITLGANVNKPLRHSSRTPLMFAVYKGVLQAASFLLEKGLSGAEVSSRDINGLNIIHYAVDSNILENVQFSVNTNLAIDEQDNNGWTPLMRALMLQCKPEILEYLLLNGASTEIRDKNGFDFKKHLKISKFVQQLHFLTFLKK